jgi:hypothetical protein
MKKTKFQRPRPIKRARGDIAEARRRYAPEDRVLTNDAAEIIGCSPSKLNQMRSAKTGPRFLRVGGQIQYVVRDIDAWLASCAVDTSESHKEKAA